MKTLRIFITLLTLAFLSFHLTSCTLVERLLLGVYYDEHGVQYVRSEDGSAFFLTDATECLSASYTVPATFKGKPVIIQTGAFSLNTSIQTLNVEKGVTGREKCFTSPSITSVTLPEGFALPFSAFYSCTALTTVHFPSDITSIPGETFLYCTALTEMTIPEGVTKLGNTISSSVGAGIFKGCSSLERITLPKSLMFMASSTFRDCSSLKEIHFGDTTGWYLESSYTKPTTEAINVENPMINAQEFTNEGQYVIHNLEKRVNP